MCTNNCRLEVCAGDIASVFAAKQGGAYRVELCSALGEGGVTPSAGAIAEAVSTGIKVNVLIRPRSGDFLYNEAEKQVMIADVRYAASAGANGVVIGALTPEGDVDLSLCHELVMAAEGLEVTFHRAFDRCREPQRALEDIIALGCTRLLTSGQAADALTGAPLIETLVRQAAGRISIMPGCGVNVSNVAQIVSATGVWEVHSSASAIAMSRMLFCKAGVSMGNRDADEDSIKTTSADVVRSIVSALNGIHV